MKKILLLVSLSFFCFFTKGQIMPLTLNGYSRDQAHTYVHNFNFKNHTPTNFWFSRQEIEDIISLIADEQKLTTQKIDGIRFYWGSTNGQSNDALILVSTYDAGASQIDPGKEKHLDYFEHDKSKKLYTDTFPNTQGIFGDLCNGATCSNGALLYTDCGSDPCKEDEKCTQYPDKKLHYTTRIYAQKMVKEFSKANNPDIVTEAEWYDLGMIQEINHDMKTYHPNDYDGLRIYFGKHPQNDPISAGAEAFVIEATTSSSGGGNIHSDSFNCNLAQSEFDKMNKKKTLNNIIQQDLISHPELKIDSNAAFDFITNGAKIDPFFKQEFMKNNKFSAKIKDYNTLKINLLKALILANGLENGEICPTHCDGALLILP